MADTVLITGCSSGIGRAVAHRFADEGWNVSATMRDIARSGDLAGKKGVLVSALDVEDRRSIEGAVSDTLATFGAIDVLVNNAGYGLYGIFETLSIEQVHHQFAVNLFGVMNVCRAVLPHLRARQSGVIVNVSSGAGVVTVPLLSVYSSSKFALEGFSEGLYYELASQNIKVKIIEPGSVGDTGFTNRSTGALNEQGSIPDYDAFMTKAFGRVSALAGNEACTSEQIADCIYKAATDATIQLRYIPSADIEPLLAARRETSEDEYMEFMRTNFM